MSLVFKGTVSTNDLSNEPKLIVFTNVGETLNDIQSFSMIIYSNKFTMIGLLTTINDIPRPEFKYNISINSIYDSNEVYSKILDNLLFHVSYYPDTKVRSSYENLTLEMWS